jgi:hypothetical protein
MTKQKVGTFEQTFANFGRALDEFVPVFHKAIKTFAASLETESYDRYQMRKWLSQVPHGGMVGNMAVLIVYNEEAPERSEVIVEVVE